MTSSISTVPRAAHRRPSRVALCLLLLLLATTVSADDGHLAALLSSHGIRPIEPPSAAADFELPTLSGERVALSSFRGQWVVLTFFATWCGPCRGELPTLERLHDAQGAAGLAVLGVSIDRDRRPLGPFLADLGVTFPVLWDERSQVGRTYRADSIPLTYLIDPGGRIVGVSRGSRDWAVLGGMLARAREILPSDPNSQPVYATASAPVDLPIQLTPPSGTWRLSDPAPRRGEPFYLDVAIEWAGSFDEYLLHPPSVVLPDGIRQEHMSASTSSASGRSLVTYRLTLASDREGSFALDPIELRYTPRLESVVQAARLTGPTIDVVAPRGPLGAAVLASAAALMALLAATTWWRLRRRRQLAANSVSSPLAPLEVLVAAMRRSRLEGDAAGFLERLADLDAGLSRLERADGPVFEVGDCLEQARYGGVAPAPEQLDRWLRQVERRLERLRPTPEGEARAGLRLEEHPQGG